MRLRPERPPSHWSQRRLSSGASRGSPRPHPRARVGECGLRKIRTRLQLLEKERRTVRKRPKRLCPDRYRGSPGSVAKLRAEARAPHPHLAIGSSRSKRPPAHHKADANRSASRDRPGDRGGHRTRTRGRSSPQWPDSDALLAASFALRPCPNDGLGLQASGRASR